MSIINVLIAEDKKPLCDYSDYRGNFQELCISLLAKIEPETMGLFQLSEGYTYYYKNENNINYVCLADSGYNKDSAYGCINAIYDAFKVQYSKTNMDFSNVVSCGLNDQFQSVLKDKFKYFNEHKNICFEQNEKLKEKLIGLKEEVFKANDLLNSRGEKLTLIVKKADELTETSKTYYNKSRNVYKAARWKRMKVTLCLIGAGLIILFFLLLIVCGKDFCFS
jgi:hypothetical protein